MFLPSLRSVSANFRCDCVQGHSAFRVLYTEYTRQVSSVVNEAHKNLDLMLKGVKVRRYSGEFAPTIRDTRTRTLKLQARFARVLLNSPTRGVLKRNFKNSQELRQSILIVSGLDLQSGSNSTQHLTKCNRNEE